MAPNIERRKSIATIFLVSFIEIIYYLLIKKNKKNRAFFEIVWHTIVIYWLNNKWRTLNYQYLCISKTCLPWNNKWWKTNIADTPNCVCKIWMLMYCNAFIDPKIKMFWLLFLHQAWYDWCKVFIWRYNPYACVWYCSNTEYISVHPRKLWEMWDDKPYLLLRLHNRILIFLKIVLIVHLLFKYWLIVWIPTLQILMDFK